MFVRLLILFTVIPLTELYILFLLANVFGFFTTLFIVLGTGALGAYHARAQGLAVWQRVAEELRKGRFPGEELLDALCLLVAGVVLITPGVLTDILGFVLLFPGSRSVVKLFLKKKFKEMVQSGRFTNVQRNEPWDG